MRPIQQSQSEVRDAGPLPNIPMAVISLSLVEDFSPGFAEDSIKSTWDELQADLSKGATMPQVIAANSGHYIHIDRPKLVIQTVLKMVDMSQGE